MSVPTPWNSYGEGVLKAKFEEANYEAKLEFHGGRRVQNKTPTVGGVWIFSGTTHSSLGAGITAEI